MRIVSGMLLTVVLTITLGASGRVVHPAGSPAPQPPACHGAPTPRPDSADGGGQAQERQRFCGDRWRQPYRFVFGRGVVYFFGGVVLPCLDGRKFSSIHTPSLPGWPPAT